jgi:3-phenylpropionate/cinnamic acid dioxygenase small subunit
MSEQVTMGLTRERAEAFLYREAQFTDEHRFDEWMALWDDDDDIIYWIPCDQDDIDPRRHVSIAYEDRQTLEERLIRLKSRGMHSQEPRSRMRRVISNVVIESETSCWWNIAPTCKAFMAAVAYMGCATTKRTFEW